MKDRSAGSQKKTWTFKGIILLSPGDLRDIISGETTIGFKYDGIGCVFGSVLLFLLPFLHILFPISKYMLLHWLLLSLAGLPAIPLAIVKKDYETFFLRRYYAVVAPPIIALAWFACGGITSPLGYVWMVAIVSYNSFLVTGKKGKFYVGYAIGVNLIAMLLCALFPNLVLPVANTRNILIQSVIAGIAVCIYIGLTTWFQRKIAENLQDKLADYNEELKTLNEELETNLRRQMELELREETLKQQKKQAEETTVLLVRTLSDAIETRDEYLHGHSDRVSDYAVLIARKMGLPEDEIARLEMAATLHDIGKIGVPDAVLNKPTRLTDEEYDIIKGHCNTGADLLKNIDIIAYTEDVARHHHERYNGSGYPDGLKGEEISLSARIVAVADSFDAMNSKRVYRDPLPREVIRGEIEKGKGTQFDPAVADVFLELYDSGAIDAAAQGK